DLAPAAAAEVLQPLQVRRRMDTAKLLGRRAGQVGDWGQAGSREGVEARGEPLRAFRVVGTPVVGLGRRVGVDDRLQRFLPTNRCRVTSACGILCPYADGDRRLGRWRDPR